MADQNMPPAPAPSPAPSPAPKPAGGFVSNPLELLKPSIEAIKVNLGAILVSVLIPFGIALLAIFVLLGGAAMSANGFNPAALFGGSFLLLLVLAVLLIVFAPAWTILSLASTRGQKVSFMDALKRAPKYSLRFLGAGILAGLAVLGGLILLIIPGIIFMAWFVNFAYAIVDEDLGAVESLKRSKQLAKGRVVEILGVVMFGSALGVLGIIPVLGAIVATVVALLYMMAPAIRYNQLKALPPGSKAEVHWMNWLVLVLAVVASVLDFQAGKKTQDEQPDAPYDFQYGSEEL